MKPTRKREKGSILEPQFTNEDAAREFLEKMRWPEGAVCPHCGLVGEAYRIVRKEPDLEKLKLTRQRYRKPQKGLWKCAGCRKQFTVTVKTIFEDSHIPLHKWLLAIHLMCASKKGVSAHQLMRMLDIKQYKSAWFMAHRIRYAMTGELPEKLNGVVEADSTFIGGKLRNKTSQQKKAGRDQDHYQAYHKKAEVFSVVQRGGKVHSRHVERVTADNLSEVLNDVCERDAHLITDTASVLIRANKDSGDRKHSLINHTADEYVRYEEGFCVTTNTVEGYFSILKRGINGVYHHVGREHLHRYLGEFDFRYNERQVTDGERAAKALKGFDGKRLTYKGSAGQA
jgi:transposase-like protein